MKTMLARHSSLLIAAGLTLMLGCARPAAQPDRPATVAAPPPPPVTLPVTAPVVAPVATAPAVAAAPAPTAPADTNAPAILDSIPPATLPTAAAMTPGLAEVVKLVQANVGEEVVLAYVEKYSGNFNVGADQIVYLNDLGASDKVITSLLKHDGASEAAAATAVAAAPNVQTQAVSNVALNPPAAPATAPAAAPVQTVAPPPTSSEVSYFYDSLSPYGSWIYLSGYGWCWQPTVAVSVSAWRPYSDRGRWYWSDGGWYWHSDYSWGWAAFHYGRWYHHSRCGWVWTPGLVWGPSWVSWRYSGDYCGWAPLPPAAHYVSGVGFTWYGSHVSVGFEFGLTDFHYSFVHTRNFCDYNPHHHFVPRPQIVNVYRNTTVINNYAAGPNHQVINRGFGRETVARSSQTPVRQVAIKDAPVQQVASGRGERIERQGNQSVVYRPQLPATPPQIRTAQFAQQPAGRGPTTVGRQTGSGNLTQPASQPATLPRATGGNSVRPSVPSAPVTPNTPSVREPRNRETVAPRTGSGGQPQPSTPASTPVRPAPAQPRESAPAAPRQQPRQSGALYGPSSGPATAPATGRSTVTQPRTAAPATPVAPRTYSAPAPTAPAQNPQRAQPAPRAAQSYSPPASPAVQPRATVTPRQYEQSPRVSAPPQSAPQYSRPAGGGGAPSLGRSSPPQSVGRAEGGGRGERNR